MQDAPMAKQGIMTGIAVGGCCELSTSAHHLIDKIGTEQGYLLAESNGLDIDDAIHVAKRLSRAASQGRSGAIFTNMLSRAAATPIRPTQTWRNNTVHGSSTTTTRMSARNGSSSTSSAGGDMRRHTHTQGAAGAKPAPRPAAG